MGVHRVGPELWRGGVVGFEHGTTQHGTARHITAHHITAHHSTTYSIAQHITAQHSTTQPLRPPKRALLPPSLPPSPPSLPSLPPLPPPLPPCRFPACVVEVREDMPVFLFSGFLFQYSVFPPAYQGPNPKKVKIGGMLLRSLVSSGGGWRGHRSPRRPLDTYLPPHQFHMPPLSIS